MERRPVYVYALEGPPEGMRRQATQYLGDDLCHWTADTAHLDIGEGVPGNWRDQGAIFGIQGELRWQRQEDDYQVLLLTEAPVSDLEPLPGNWEGEEQSFFLQHLTEPRVHPPFTTYPGGGTSGKFKAMVYYRDGAATFISPRGLMSEAGGA